MWWLLPTACLCGLIEIIGWAGRLWSSWNPFNDAPFQMQICCTIIGPTPLLAASFIILGNIIKKLGPGYSRLTPKWYTIVFCSSGAHVMLVGIVFQLLVIVVFSACAAEFYYRYLNRLPVARKSGQQDTGSNLTLSNAHGTLTPNIQILSYALVFSTLVFFIRSIYRIIELSDGWNGRIIQTEVYFNVLDGAMITLAIYTLNIFHPGRLLHTDEENKEAKLDTLNV
ncbi:hypothetical protein CVT25_004575 [Psilocybe cyanescens]|uniref:Uncharacterized protein n=1 Tax=Psilocybe cyanescens TaxID=93625 RepID=A0A409X2C7_PSICY|nr:hypothetical protein CVT25_004575 [Psilocybe cyanescens]